MLSFLANKFNPPTSQSEFYPQPRSEGRVKSHDSCSDFRAWSLHEQDLHDYLVYVIKLNDVDPHGFLSKRTLFDLLSILFGGGGDTGGGGLGGAGQLDLNQFSPSGAGNNGLEGLGDRECAQEMSKKDDEINDLRNELGDWQAKYNDLLNKMKQMDTSGFETLGLEPNADSDFTTSGTPEVSSGLENVKPCSVCGDCERKEKMLQNMKAELEQLKQDKIRLSDHNAVLAKNVDEFNEHIDTLSNLKEKISEYAESGQFCCGNKGRYKELLEDTLRAVIHRETMCTNKDMKKERKKYEEQIKEQLAEMLEMYEDAVNKCKQMEEELEKNKTNTENLKLENDLISNKYINGGEDGNYQKVNDDDNDSIATIEEIAISTSAPLINIEMTQNFNTLNQRFGGGGGGCNRNTCRALNASYSEQQIQDGGRYNEREGNVERNRERQHRGSNGRRNHPVLMSSTNRGNGQSEYALRGCPSIEVKIPFTNYVLLLKPER